MFCFNDPDPVPVHPKIAQSKSPEAEASTGSMRLLNIEAAPEGAMKCKFGSLKILLYPDNHDTNFKLKKVGRHKLN